MLDALTYAGNRDNLQPAGARRGFLFVHGDIRDVAVVDRLVAESDQIVRHRVRGARGLAVRRRRPQLRGHDDRPGAHARERAGRQRPDGPAHLGRRPGRTPTRLADAAEAGTAPPGVYHGTSSGEISWHGLAQEVFRLLGADPSRVLPVTSGEFGLPAARPGYSALGHGRWDQAGIPPLRHWRSALHAAFPLLQEAHAQKGRTRESIRN